LKNDEVIGFLTSIDHCSEGWSCFKNLRRKGSKFDHRPGRPKVLLHHWVQFLMCYRADLPSSLRLSAVSTQTYFKTELFD